MKHDYTPKEAEASDGDPLTLSPAVVKRLRRDEHSAALFFHSKLEAFSAGLAIGIAAAEHAAKRTS